MCMGVDIYTCIYTCQVHAHVDREVEGRKEHSYWSLGLSKKLRWTGEKI